MKKKLLIVLVLLLVVFGVLIYLFVIKGEGKFFIKSKENDPEIEEIVNISQPEMSSFIFVIQESETNHILNINITPFLSFIIEQKEVKSFNIENFVGTNPDSEVIFIPPTDLPLETLSRTFLFTVQDSITQKDIVFTQNNFDYEVVSQPSKYNEVSNMGILTPYFGIIVKDIGSVNYKEVLDREGSFDGGKYFDYSGISLDTIDTEIQFDVSIQFTDGNEYNKRFKGVLLGETFVTETSPMITLESEE